MNYWRYTAGKDTASFCTPDASGSTSQAANIQEALELGSTCLLLDEDVCATNFMIRDARMQVPFSVSIGTPCKTISV